MEETLHIELCEMKDEMDFEWYETKVYKICYHNIHGKHTNEKRLLNFHSEAFAEREGFYTTLPTSVTR